MSVAIDNLIKMDVYDLLTGLVGAAMLNRNTTPYVDQIGIRFQQLRDENTRLRRELEDFRDHGLRADLHPTYDLNNSHGFWHEYIAQIDESVRNRAKDALDGGKRKEKREAGQTVDDPPPVELFLQEYFTPNEEA